MDIRENEKIETSLVEELPISFSPMKLKEILNISKSKAYLLANSNAFPVLKIGKRIVIMRKHFLEWLNSNCN